MAWSVCSPGLAASSVPALERVVAWAVRVVLATSMPSGCTWRTSTRRSPVPKVAASVEFARAWATWGEPLTERRNDSVVMIQP